MRATPSPRSRPVVGIGECSPPSQRTVASTVTLNSPRREARMQPTPMRALHTGGSQVRGALHITAAARHCQPWLALGRLIRHGPLQGFVLSICLMPGPGLDTAILVENKTDTAASLMKPTS